MADIFPPSKQRPALVAFAEAACTRTVCLRRDECGDWAIFGDNGHIYALPGRYQLMIGCHFDSQGWSSTRGWESAKQRLSFGRVTQDGDMDGCIVLDCLPTKMEAAQIRNILGIPKRRELGEEQLAALPPPTPPVTPENTMRLSPSEAMARPLLFGPYFAGHSWAIWRAVVAATFGERLTDAEDELFQSVAGRRPPLTPVKELVCACGRGARKDSIASC